jgi:hypothetical protein
MGISARSTAALAFAAALSGCATAPPQKPHPGNDIVCKVHGDKSTVFTGRANGYINGDASRPTQVQPSTGGNISFKGDVKCAPAGDVAGLPPGQKAKAP